MPRNDKASMLSGLNAGNQVTIAHELGHLLLASMLSGLNAGNQARSRGRRSRAGRALQCCPA